MPPSLPNSILFYIEQERLFYSDTICRVKELIIFN